MAMIDHFTRFAVIGHGSWATAIVKILTDNRRAVDWYVRNDEVREHIATHRSNPKYLSEVRFHTRRMVLHDNVSEAVENAQVIILATPSAFIKDVLADLFHPLKDKFVISAIKGIVPDEYITIAEYLNQYWDLPFDNIGVVTGPCHAEEVALERLSYLTIACKSIERAEEIAKAIANDYIRVTCSTDIYGTEYGAVLKNIYAIAVGICHSLGFGDNFTSVVIANAAIEMERFMKGTYQFDRQILASAYLGDLLVTCYSGFSRNRTFGQLLGKGYSVKVAQMEMNMVAEGYYATACVKELKDRLDIKIDMPIADAMYRIIYERKNAKKEFQNILPKFI